MDLTTTASIQAAALVFLSLTKGDPLDWRYASAAIAANVVLALLLCVARSKVRSLGPVALPLWMGCSLAPFTIADGVGPSLVVGSSVAALMMLSIRVWDLHAGVRGVISGSSLFAGLAVAPGLTKSLNMDSELAATTLQACLVGLTLVVGHLLARRRPQATMGFALIGVIAVVLSGYSVRGESPKWREEALDANAGKPNVLLLVLDTVRADRLSLYGHIRKTSPALESFVARYPGARVYPSAHSNGTWTPPSHASLLTGLLPSEHGIHAASLMRQDGPRDPQIRADRTLAEALHERGYRTGCVYANSWFDHLSEFRRGFDYFARPRNPAPIAVLPEVVRARFLTDWFELPTSVRARAAHVNDKLVRVLDACLPGPCFILANYMDAHAPYRPLARDRELFADPGDPKEIRSPRYGDSTERLRKISNLYDAEIHGLDRELGQLFTLLEARGVIDEFWIVVTSDHGEAFAEHDEVEHGSTVYAEVTRIPLIIKPPKDVELPVLSGPISLIDVATTLGAIAGVERFGSGRDLRQSGTRAQNLELFENWRKRDEREMGSRAGSPARAVIDGPWKLIDHGGTIELYDLARDPAERKDLSASQPTRVRALQRLLTDVTSHAEEEAPKLQMTNEEAERLRALGYVE